MSGHVVMWTCLCSDAADHAAWLAERCPGHDRPQVCAPIANIRPGGVTAGHECGEAQCAA